MKQYVTVINIVILAFELGCLAGSAKEATIDRLDDAAIGPASVNNPLFTFLMQQPVTSKWIKINASLYEGPTKSIYYFDKEQLYKVGDNTGGDLVLKDKYNNIIYKKNAIYDPQGNITGYSERCNLIYNEYGQLIGYTEYCRDSTGNIIKIKILKDGVLTIDIPQELKNKIQTYTDDEILKMDPDYVRFLTKDKLESLNSSTFDVIQAYFSTEQVQQLSKNYIHLLSGDNIARLSLNQIGLLHAQDFNSWSQDQINGLTREQMDYISDATIQQLNWTTIGKMNEKLSDDQIHLLSKNQVYGLSPDNISKLTLAQVSGLDAYQLNYFDSGQISALSQEQIQS
ncbi:MAG: hypothetical protein JW774_03585, partial [Candidatus Aureabacteria bacterium]|nr:hypothetical protein [Candidatus Auribacterota bacterium]